MTFKNKHLSYSRLSRFEKCPLSFKLHYIDEKSAEPGVALIFGKNIHSVLERLLLEHRDAKKIGVLDAKRAVELWQQIWAETGLSGAEVFQEGFDILKSFIRDQGVVDWKEVLAIEEEFVLPVGPFSVLGYIDRVDRIDDETVEIIDYKTNRQIFTREEVDGSLQMSLYHLAAQQLWPWAKKVRLTFQMLRHGFRMSTERNQDQLDAALAYVETMGAMTENASEFPAKLNSDCVYCDHRGQCEAYAGALAGRREIICKNLEDLDAVASEREEVARLAKILNARKQELEAVLKVHLKENEELMLSGVRYKLFNTAKVEYPLAKTVEVLVAAAGGSRESLVEQLAVIDGKALEKWLKEEGKTLGKSKLNLLKAELEANTTKRYSPKFWASEVSL